MDETQNFYALVSALLNLAALLPNCLVTPYLFGYLLMKSVSCFWNQNTRHKQSSVNTDNFNISWAYQ